MKVKNVTFPARSCIKIRSANSNLRRNSNSSFQAVLKHFSILLITGDPVGSSSSKTDSVFFVFREFYWKEDSTFREWRTRGDDRGTPTAVVGSIFVTFQIYKSNSNVAGGDGNVPNADKYYSLGEFHFMSFCSIPIHFFSSSLCFAFSSHSFASTARQTKWEFILPAELQVVHHKFIWKTISVFFLSHFISTDFMISSFH